MQVGVIGLGRMGAALCERLHQQNIKIKAFDVDGERCEAVRSKGIQVVERPVRASESSDVVISIVTDDRAVRSVFADMLEADIAEKLFIQMSTVRPETIRDVARLVENRGGATLDSPVLGSIPAVREGKLLALVGGSAADLERSRVILGHLTRDVVHLGPIGAGSAVKLAVNLTMAAYLQSLAEALAITDHYEVSLDVMLGVLLEAPTSNGWLKSKLKALQGEKADISLDIDTLRKDVIDAVATGAAAGIPMPLGGGIATSLAAASANGWGTRDLAELPAFFRQFMLQRKKAEKEIGIVGAKR
jgi:3-hydroxyisobutyrate dehydrogenase